MGITKKFVFSKSLAAELLLRASTLDNNNSIILSIALSKNTLYTPAAFLIFGNLSTPF